MKEFLSNFMDARRLASVLAHLEQDRNLLRKGNLKGFVGRAEKLEALLDQLEKTPPPEDRATTTMLTKVSNAARRNVRLMKAAAAGLDRAEKRLVSVLEGAKPLRTYDGTGQEVVVGAGGSGKDRRV